MTNSSEFLKRGRAMRIRPKYKKQVSLPVDIGRLNNQQQMQLGLSREDIKWTPMRGYHGSMSRTQPERAPNEDEAKKPTDLNNTDEDAGRDSTPADECTQVGLQLRTIADNWSRTYFENDDFHQRYRRTPQLDVIVFILIFHMCT